MNIILLTNSKGKPVARQLSNRWQFMALGLVFLGIGASLVYAGYWFGETRRAPEHVQALGLELESQRTTLGRVKQETRAEINALTRRLGQLQGHITRLDALGQKLVHMADLDSGEFNFDTVPPLGGPETLDPYQSAQVGDLDQVIEQLSEQIANREHQLAVLEQLIMNRNLAAEVLPSGRPIKKGWLSSGYGKRTSPFTGKTQFHKGVDFAGRPGSEVIAVAGGVVTYAGKQGAYGFLLEISHGDDYSTRYAHNAEILVSEGEAVKKGQVIAKMGSTGRSTGPHVHFEVLKAGRQINPIKFTQK
ncbi:MAG: peptidoglycan DD-metalloendopeptidase family protein [Pseudomonadota bacterium]